MPESPRSGRCHVAHGEPAVRNQAAEGVRSPVWGDIWLGTTPSMEHVGKLFPHNARMPPLPGLCGISNAVGIPRLARRGLNDPARYAGSRSAVLILALKGACHPWPLMKGDGKTTEVLQTWCCNSGQRRRGNRLKPDRSYFIFRALGIRVGIGAGQTVGMCFRIVEGEKQRPGSHAVR